MVSFRLKHCETATAEASVLQELAIFSLLLGWKRCPSCSARQSRPSTWRNPREFDVYTLRFVKFYYQRVYTFTWNVPAFLNMTDRIPRFGYSRLPLKQPHIYAISQRAYKAREKEIWWVECIFYRVFAINFALNRCPFFFPYGGAAVQMMRNTRRSQCIILKGDCGSGKTTASHHLFTHLLFFNQVHSKALLNVFLCSL